MRMMAQVLHEEAHAMGVRVQLLSVDKPICTPANAVKAIDDAFKIAVQSETVKKFAAEKGSVVLALSGDEAQAHVAKLSSIVSWTLFDGGTAKISPEKFAIPRLK